MSGIPGSPRLLAASALLWCWAAIGPLNALAQESNISPKISALLAGAASKEDGFAQLRQHYRCIFKNTKFTSHTERIYESFYVNGYEVQRLLALNGVELSGSQKEKESLRVDAEISVDKQKAPPPFIGLAGGMTLSRGEHRWSQTVEGAIMRTGIFSNERAVVYHDRHAIQLDFAGNRKFKAQTDEERAAKALAGTVIIDEETGAVLRVGAEAVEDVNRHGWPMIVHGAHIGFDATRIDDALFLPSSWVSFHMVNVPYQTPSFYPETEDFWLQGCRRADRPEYRPE